MLTGSSASPFAVVESAIYKTLFTGYSPYAAITGDVTKACIDNGTTNTMTSTAATKESSENGSPGKHTPVSPVKGQSGPLKAKDESENAETTNCKKTN